MDINTKSILTAAALSLSVASGSAVAAGHSMTIPDDIKVPAGHEAAMKTKAVGTVAWMCAETDKGPAWKFAGPAAVLSDEMGKPAVSYYGPPATWEATDGSKITGKQLATAPAGDGNIPFQLVQANASERDGALKGVTYIQRINLHGGAAPKSGCDAGAVGTKRLVAYTGEYVFWKAQ